MPRTGGRPAPGTPQNVRAAVLPESGVRLSWTAKDAAASSGAFFEVYRRDAGEPDFTLIANVPGIMARQRTAVNEDHTIPHEVREVAYLIRARRTSKRSEPSTLAWVSLSGAGGSRRAAAA